MRGWFRLNPITRKRLRRFREIKRGYYSLIVLVLAVVVSLFANFLANSRALVVKYEGEYLFPTFRFISKAHFGQADEFGFDDSETNYRALKESFKGTDNWVILPPVPFDPYEKDFAFYSDHPPNPPDGRHWLGTDMQGRDVLARLLYGFRISMLFALSLVVVSKIIGVAIGCMQGYFSGWFDLYSQRFIEIWSTLPFLYVVVLLGTIFPPNFSLLLIVMVVFEWMGITYYMRTEMYREKAREYALAAKAMGASHARIIFKHLLPNCLVPLVTLTPFSIIGGIFALTALDFLGYGLPSPTPSWGELIDQALQSDNRDKLWLSLSPFLAITITLTLVALIGEAIREAFDPKPYARYQ
jgi:microcin C transport system permease protein